MQRRQEHNQGRKYGNESLPQQHNMVFPAVLSFQLLGETEEMECVLCRGRQRTITPDSTASLATAPVQLATGILDQYNVP